MPTKPYKESLLERLSDSEYAVEYLTNVLQDESQEAFLLALSYVIEAKGYTIPQLADEVGLTKQGLYKLLSDGGNPRLSTLSQVLDSIGMKLRIEVD